jgi:hypothetical protein
MATIPIEIQPFDVPDEVHLVLPPGSGLRQHGLRPTPSLRLIDLPRSTIEAMCDEFKSRLLTKYEHAAAAAVREDEDQSFRTTHRGG